MTLKEKMRTGHVKRWHIVRVGREQTIAEHMYRVWLICREMARRIGMGSEALNHVEQVALLHDMTEVVTGDIPTPTKQAIEKSSSCLSRLEFDADEVFFEFEYKVFRDYPEVKYIVKLADLVEAIYFLMEEGIGDHAKSVEKLLDLQYHKILNEVKQKILNVDWDMIHGVYEELLSGIDHSPNSCYNI